MGTTVYKQYFPVLLFSVLAVQVDSNFWVSTGMKS